jgi:hypothetical protein
LNNRCHSRLLGFDDPGHAGDFDANAEPLDKPNRGIIYSAARL